MRALVRAIVRVTGRRRLMLWASGVGSDTSRSLSVFPSAVPFVQLGEFNPDVGAVGTDPRCFLLKRYGLLALAKGVPRHRASAKQINLELLVRRSLGRRTPCGFIKGNESVLGKPLADTRKRQICQYLMWLRG